MIWWIKRTRLAGATSSNSNQLFGFKELDRIETFLLEKQEIKWVHEARCSSLTFRFSRWCKINCWRHWAKDTFSFTLALPPRSGRSAWLSNALWAQTVKAEKAGSRRKAIITNESHSAGTRTERGASNAIHLLPPADEKKILEYLKVYSKPGSVFILIGFFKKE